MPGAYTRALSLRLAAAFSKGRPNLRETCLKSAVLRGREHVDIGLIDVIGEAGSAIAISRGGAPKTYGYTDPNEDVTAFALGREGTLLAVADGHSGFEASEVVIEHLLSHPAPHWTDGEESVGAAWSRHAVATLCDANEEVLRERGQGFNFDSATTLASALIRPEDDDLLILGVGDSHVFVIEASGNARELAAGGDRPTWFLGATNENPERLARRCRIESHSLDGLQAVVCCTDGLSEQGIGVEDPVAAVTASFAHAGTAPPELRPIHLARGLCELSNAAHREGRSGDNIAVAVHWLGPRHR